MVMKSGNGRTQPYCASDIFTRRFDGYGMPFDMLCSKMMWAALASGLAATGVWSLRLSSPVSLSNQNR